MNWTKFCARCEYNLDCDIECADAKAHQRTWWVRLGEWWENVWFQFTEFWRE
jgi:hypothetical protein